MTANKQLLFWAGFILCLIVALVLFSPVLLPFVAGMVLAYFLDPLADKLEGWGLGRIWATLLVLLIAGLVFLVLLLLPLPVIGKQFAQFAASLPDIFARLMQLFQRLPVDALLESIGVGKLELNGSNIQSALGDLVQPLIGWLGQLLSGILYSGQAAISALSLMIVTPVVAFYMINDWDRMVRTVDSWLPRDHADTIRSLVREMDETMSAFVRGQLTVSSILTAIYMVGLTLVQLPYGLLIGLIAGLVSIIPYLGTFVGLTLGLGVAFAHFWPDWVQIVLVGLVFGVGQFLEGNILQPKLIGGKVRLHPVWLMFSLFAFGLLFGFVGLLVAVPVAAMIGVLTRFGLSQYLASPLYHGKSEGKADP